MKAGKSNTPVRTCTWMMPCSPSSQNKHDTQHLVSSVKTFADMSYGIEVWGPGDNKSAMWSCGCELQLCMSALFLASLSSLPSLPRLPSNLLYVSGWPQPSCLHLLSARIAGLHYHAQLHSSEQNTSDVSAVGLTYFWNVDFPFDILMKAMYLLHIKR